MTKILSYLFASIVGLLIYSCSDNNYAPDNSKLLLDADGRSIESYSTSLQGQNLFIFKVNNSGNVEKSLLIQGINVNIEEKVSGFRLLESGKKAQIYTESKTIEYNLDSEVNGSLIYGISLLQNLNNVELTIQTILSNFNDPKKGCADTCISGGCGATSCSREVWEAGCSVSCGSGYFACCGDLLSQQCGCKKDACCTSSGTTIGPR